MKPRPSIFIPDLESYMDEEFVRRPHPIFEAVEEEAKEKNVPILTPSSGAVLSFLVRMAKPSQILELGTGLGYSTFWMLYGSNIAKIQTIDRNEEQTLRMWDYAKKLNLTDRISTLTGNLPSVLVDLPQPLSEYDFYFIDCDKIQYPDLLESFWKEARENSHFVLDNMLWHGRVMQKESDKPSDLAIQKVWKFVKDRELVYTLFPAGDGLLYFQKGKKY